MNKILQFQNLGSELFPSDNNETIIVVTEEKTVTNWSNEPMNKPKKKRPEENKLGKYLTKLAR